MPFSLIPFLLLVIPVLEIAAFVVIGGQIGLFWTLLLILATAVAGSILLRIQGFRVLSEIRAVLDRGAVPGRELGHGAMILAAGVLLLTPGFITDSIGFLLFLPPVRNAIWGFLASRISVAPFPGPYGQGSQGQEPGHGPYRRADGGVVDLDPGEFHREEDDGPAGGKADTPWKPPAPGKTP